MRGGQLRKRLEIQSYDSSTKDAHGNPVRQWTTDQVRWGKIEPIAHSGKEIEFAEGKSARLTHEITIRFYRGISAKQRIRYAPPGASPGDSGDGVRIFNIKEVINKNERSIQHILRCTEGLPNG